jgi:hypothetical protein
MSSKSYSLRTADLLAITFKNNHNHFRSRYVVTKGNFICCSKCCSVFRERFALSDPWEIVADGLNRSDKFLHCDSCESRIPVSIPRSFRQR